MLRNIILAAAVAAAPFAAQAEPWVLDKAHAHITFSVSHLGFSTTRGSFRNFDAEIDFNPDDIEAAKVTVTIDAASVDTFFDKRDQHLRGADFLDVENHESITFASTSVSKTGDDTATVTGDLTIVGVTHPATFEAKLIKIDASPFDKEKTVAGLSLNGEIDRAAFGIAYGVPAIGGIIPVEIDLEMSPAN